MLPKSVVVFVLALACLSAAQSQVARPFCEGMLFAYWTNGDCTGEPSSYQCSGTPLNKCSNTGTGSAYFTCTSNGAGQGIFSSIAYVIPNCNTSAYNTYSQSVGTCSRQSDGTGYMVLCSSNSPLPAKFPLLTSVTPGPTLPTTTPCSGDLSSCPTPLSFASYNNGDCTGNIKSAQSTGMWPDICYVTSDLTINTKFTCKDGVLRMENFKGCDKPPLYAYSFNLVDGYSPCINGGRYFCK